MIYNKREICIQRTIVGEKIHGGTENWSKWKRRKSLWGREGDETLQREEKREHKMGEKSRWYFISLHRMASHYHQI